MSKAFVKEDADAPETSEVEAPSPPPGGKNYITPAGFARLQREKQQLVEVERPEVVKTVAWAASLGDRSENADYIYGKRRLREIDRRVRFLIKQQPNRDEETHHHDRDSKGLGAHATTEDRAELPAEHGTSCEQKRRHPGDRPGDDEQHRGSAIHNGGEHVLEGVHPREQLEILEVGYP